MSNEKISFAEVKRRAAELRPGTNNRTLTIAWEDVAWCDTLTDERLLQALSRAEIIFKQKQRGLV